MKPLRAIQYKALFLLITFSLNTVVGFACSLGVDMGFNSDHHSHESGQQHEHADTDHHHEHDGNPSHGHQHEAISNHHADDHNNIVFVTFQSKENCCKDFVVGFQNMDKTMAKGSSSIQQQTLTLSSFIVPLIPGLNTTKGFAQHYQIPPEEIDLPPPDIIVFIQSFLI